jgi:hypothetical protein
MSTKTDEMMAFLALCDPDSEPAALALLAHEFPDAPESERQEAARIYVLEAVSAARSSRWTRSMM